MYMWQLKAFFSSKLQPYININTCHFKAITLNLTGSSYVLLWSGILSQFEHSDRKWILCITQPLRLLMNLCCSRQTGSDSHYVQRNYRSLSLSPDVNPTEILCSELMRTVHMNKIQHINLKCPTWRNGWRHTHLLSCFEAFRQKGKGSVVIFSKRGFN